MTLLLCVAALLVLAAELWRAFKPAHRRRRTWRDVESFRRACRG